MFLKSTRMKNLGLNFASLVLCLALLWVGYLLSRHKPLWNDEISSQVESIENKSYMQILRGKLTEGNNFPLFYLSQKVFLDLIHFRVPFVWDHEWYVYELRSQIFLRILPNICMALALTLIFYFLSRYLALWIGGYAFLLALTSPMVWAYWVEARPYALWFFLTTIQSVLFLKSEYSRKKLAPRRALILTHMLLSLTTSLGILQVAAGSFFLWLRGERDLRYHFGLTLVPLLFSGLYYSLAIPKTVFHLLNFWPYFLCNIPLGSWILFSLYILSLGYSSFRKDYREANAFEGRYYLIFLASIFMATLLFMVVMKFRSAPVQEGFGLQDRHFLFLAPIGILGASVFLFDLIRWTRLRPWVRLNVVIVALGILMIQIFDAFSKVISLKIYY